ncbi:SDR family NAD(P)-dependent oxidoreductase [Pollutimonas bauzanensis]|uniref:NAD(P)-dependent dehydrogenase, short-chain alcohol dehydrogenase family n=1 Tax=Pollutimonas bauzanensis TaxID=658167 RepID=A0A1M5V517_9BURK|nr:SDR family oxidoreductase [Pollutimonas bauzanensis]SHH70043.1 NAD(P)-dependent dehydrogenase, short-chain alcohol dehydrogenase family [Pollutimonas bauzanensis]
MGEQRKVLVTGASRGIGRAICNRLHADGYAVVGIARTRPADLPEGMDFHCADLSSAEDLRGLLKKLAAQGPYHGLVNNVGLVQSDPLADVLLEDLHRAVALNLEAAILCAQALIGGMREAGFGRIVNISSRAALGKQSRTIYSATKAGVIGMTRTWALEFAAQGVTVNAVAPGPIATEFFWDANPDRDATTAKLLAAIPVGRIGEPDDVANAVAYLLDRRTGFVTGQTHFVCGGMTVGAA